MAAYGGYGGAATPVDEKNIHESAVKIIKPHIDSVGKALKKPLKELCDNADALDTLDVNGLRTLYKQLTDESCAAENRTLGLSLALTGTADMLEGSDQLFKQACIVGQAEYDLETEGYLRNWTVKMLNDECIGSGKIRQLNGEHAPLVSRINEVLLRHKAHLERSIDEMRDTPEDDEDENDAATIIITTTHTAAPAANSTKKRSRPSNEGINAYRPPPKKKTSVQIPASAPQPFFDDSDSSDGF